MSVLVVRHGLSEANNHLNVGTMAFASSEAPLMERGIEQARQLGVHLTENFGVYVRPLFPVATSGMLRTQQTAREAGFALLNTYANLNEVDHGIELTELRLMLDRQVLPDTALRAAEALISDPPQESIWFTHGLVIASLSQILGVAQDQRFIPRFCEVRELPIRLEWQDV